ncbi:hypothetical protein C7271_03500 [filamentous cyanobacterium CCP5]|nr:hypothetical protein C7271_03500 [filamentous cyanobacterium CCP5]
MSWKQTLQQGASILDQVGKQLRPLVLPERSVSGPINVLTYRGYGTPDWLHLEGRVLQDQGIKLREENAPVWKNLWNMYRRFDSNEIRGARLKFTCGSLQQEVQTDHEGFYSTDLYLREPLEPSLLWHGVEVELLEPETPGAINSSRAQAIVVCQDLNRVSEANQTRFGVISDIDDTIMHTAATDFLKMIRIAYLGNERTRSPFPGVPEFYRALQGGESGRAGNPIFYVSSSATNLYDLFEKFMDINDVPPGPILLRHIEFSLENWLTFDHRLHKREKIEPILRRFPQLPFLLIGDSGQKDIEIYQQLLVDFPDQIAAIYIRNVTPQDPVRQQRLAIAAGEIRQRGCEFLLFEATAQARDHAVRRGWIQAGEDAHSTSGY